MFTVWPIYAVDKRRRGLCLPPWHAHGLPSFAVLARISAASRALAARTSVAWTAQELSGVRARADSLLCSRMHVRTNAGCELECLRLLQIDFCIFDGDSSCLSQLDVLVWVDP